MAFEKKNQQFQQLFEELIYLAEQDGTITKSEAEVLKKVEFSVNQFNRGLTKALDDGVITDAESLMLESLEQDFLQRIFDLIEKDEKLDQDARNIVSLLFDVVMNTLEIDGYEESSSKE